MGRCCVYGRFFSDNAEPPYGCRIEEVPESACASRSGVSRQEASARLSAGHKCFQFINDEVPVLCFWVGRGGACRVGSKERKLADGCPYAYGFSSPLADALMLRNLLLCSEKNFLEKGQWKLLFCTEIELPPPIVSATGLSLVARSTSLFPSLVCVPAKPSEPLPRRATEALHQHMPGVFSLASGLLSASSLRRCVFSGNSSGRRFTVLFNGPRSMANYYAGVLFGPSSRWGAAPGIIQGRAARPDVEMEWRAKGTGKKAGTMVLPSFSRAILDIESPFEEFIGSLGESAWKDIRKIKKNGLSSAVSYDILDFLLFYHSMYLPMVGSRHGRHSLYVSFGELLFYARSGFLMFITKADLPVAAILVIPSGKSLVGKTMGVLAGSSEHTRAGANAAIIYFYIKTASEMGYSRVDIGYSSPFGCDGVLKFKSKWGVRIVADRNTDLLCMRFRNEAVKQAFLSACSPLALETLETYDPPNLIS